MFWCRYRVLLAQVCFLGRDLRRKTGFHALQWRRSSLFFHTCPKNTPHLRQEHLAPAPLHYSVHLFEIKALLLSELMVDGCTARCTRVEVSC